MAGIGFELRKLLDRDSFLGLIRAYGYAGLIGSGPWILSIFGIGMIGIFCIGTGGGELLSRFWTSVTYVTASSLTLTGFLQLHFTRFVADRSYEENSEMILPNLHGALILTTAVAGSIGGLVALFLFDESLAFRILLLASFVVACNTWIVVVFVTGLKAYREVLVIFAIGYGSLVLSAYALSSFGLEGLIGGFLFGHALLLFLLLGLVTRLYPSRRWIGFEFLQRRYSFYSLAVTGFLYNLALWSDKIVFWMHTETSTAVIGPFRGSPIYDLPVFLAYLTVLPGMAVFLFRIETDFAEYYERFFGAVRGGGTLNDIEQLRDRLVTTVRRAIYEIFRVQGWTVVASILVVAPALTAAGFSPVHVQLFRVLSIGVGGLVLLLALLNVFFYLDNRRAALVLCAVFLLSNTTLSIASIAIGPAAHGFGFATSAILTSFVGLAVLGRQLDRLVFETFMLRN